MRTLLDRPNIIQLLQSLRFWWNSIRNRRRRMTHPGWGRWINSGGRFSSCIWPTAWYLTWIVFIDFQDNQSLLTSKCMVCWKTSQHFRSFLQCSINRRCRSSGTAWDRWECTSISNYNNNSNKIKNQFNTIYFTCYPSWQSDHCLYRLPGGAYDKVYLEDDQLELEDSDFYESHF